MSKLSQKGLRRERIRKRIRPYVKGTAEKPRLSVFRSNRQIYAQLIDDEAGATIVSCSSQIKELSSQPLSKTDLSKEVGKQLAQLAVSKGIERVVFDRNGYLYHGRVKALAEGAREGGLKF